jgi:hypothetical protein
MGFAFALPILRLLGIVKRVNAVEALHPKHEN